jgi:NAD(P)-dependent dehydrogenase (short-subunit alcohol dehydrogenase family)
MKEFQGKVAVITGGASGIGRSMAERFAEEGMKIVLADIEFEALRKAEAEMKADGAEVIAVQCDISKAHDVKMLAQKTVDAYDTAHILCNNAGVGISGYTWEIDLEDWDWVMGVNLYGVVYGLHYFVPIMLENGEECHIVNTSSMAGLTSGLNMSPYFVTKHGVVAISETLHKELETVGSSINVSVLCPAWVDTKINDSDRNRPSGAIEIDETNETAVAFREMVTQNLKDGLRPSDVSQMVFEAIQNEEFYILPHPHWKDHVETRMTDIMEQRSPTILAPPAK